MRVLITADLHYENERSRPSARQIAARACERGGDVLILAGDTFAFDFGLLRECLALFEGFEGKKVLLAGNHCVWVEEGGDSYLRYTEELPRAAARLGWHYLDAAPLVLGAVGIVGTMGWYDYSFRDASLEVPERFYIAKIGPGAALAFGRHRHLLARTDDLRPEHYGIRSRWMDGEYVRWGFTDGEMTELLAGRLAAHIARVSGAVETIVAVLHHVPFRRMVRRRHGDPSWAFANAFQGAAVFGEVLRANPKVRRVACAHVHLSQELEIDGIACANVGSRILEKRVIEWEI